MFSQSGGCQWKETAGVFWQRVQSWLWVGVKVGEEEASKNVLCLDKYLRWVQRWWVFMMILIIMCNATSSARALHINNVWSFIFLHISSHWHRQYCSIDQWKKNGLGSINNSFYNCLFHLWKSLITKPRIYSCSNFLLYRHESGSRSIFWSEPWHESKKAHFCKMSDYSFIIPPFSIRHIASHMPSVFLSCPSPVFSFAFWRDKCNSILLVARRLLLP